jgi:hypothetical protein
MTDKRAPHSTFQAVLSRSFTQSGIADLVFGACDSKIQDTAEPFYGVMFPLAEIFDAHKRFAFTRQKLHERNPHPFGSKGHRFLRLS